MFKKIINLLCSWYVPVILLILMFFVGNNPELLMNVGIYQPINRPAGWSAIQYFLPSFIILIMYWTTGKKSFITLLYILVFISLLPYLPFLGSVSGFINQTQLLIISLLSFIVYHIFHSMFYNDKSKDNILNSNMSENNLSVSNNNTLSYTSIQNRVMPLIIIIAFFLTYFRLGSDDYFTIITIFIWPYLLLFFMHTYLHFQHSKLLTAYGYFTLIVLFLLFFLNRIAHGYEIFLLPFIIIVLLIISIGGVVKHKYLTKVLTPSSK